jgi:hypothetical protein
MPTDATGTPTSLGIRKYNTSGDAPSGLGFNGAMDDIDALLVGRVTKPAGIALGEVPVWNGSTFVRNSSALNVMLPGTELAYNEGTGTVLVTATTEATANTVLGASAVTFDGATAVLIEGWFEGYDAGDAPGFSLYLYDGASSIGVLYVRAMTAGASMGSVSVKRRLTPSAASHTYSIRGTVSAGAGATVRMGVGGAGVALPGFIRITKA